MPKQEHTLSDGLADSIQSSYQIQDSGDFNSYCIGMVSLVRPSVKMDIISKARHSQIFLNSISKILSNFGAIVFKTKDDMILYFFQQSSKPHRRYGFMSCLESCVVLSNEQNNISSLSKKAGLPPIEYKISADYGEVAIMKSSFSTNIDLVGPTVNVCAKINSIAPINNAVIGSDLYQIVKRFKDYKYSQIGQYSIGFKNAYTIYSVNYN